MNNIKTIYNSFSRGKQQLILRQELLPFLIRFNSVKEEKGKSTYRLLRIEFDLLEPEIVKLYCCHIFEQTISKDELVIISVPYAVVPAILLKRIDLSFDVNVLSPLCSANRDNERHLVASRVRVSCLSEKRNYTLDTNYREYHNKGNNDRAGCSYDYPAKVDENKT